MPVQDMEDSVPGKTNGGMEEKTELEPHVLLLHKYLGQELAEYFLSPAYEIPVSPVPALLLENQGYGAKDYWRLLRKQSEERLMKYIADVPGALMAQSSNSCHISPSKLLNQINYHRRTLKLMSQASQINQEKAKLLITNNPLPELCEWQTVKSPKQYLSKDTLLTKKINNVEEPFHLPSLKSKNCNFMKKDGLSNLKTMATGIKSYRDRKEQISKSRCTNNSNVFFHLPSMHTDEKESPPRSMKGHKGSLVWEPLTYIALMDCSPSITVSGKGYYKHGQPLFWVVNHSLK